MALLEDWSRRLEDAPTFFLGGCYSSTLNEPFLKKATSNKRARRSGLARRRPKGRATTIGIVRWARRGKLAHRVSGWATLPSKVVRKAGRNGIYDSSQFQFIFWDNSDRPPGPFLFLLGLYRWLTGGLRDFKKS